MVNVGRQVPVDRRLTAARGQPTIAEVTVRLAQAGRGLLPGAPATAR